MTTKRFNWRNFDPVKREGAVEWWAYFMSRSDWAMVAFQLGQEYRATDAVNQMHYYAIYHQTVCEGQTGLGEYSRAVVTRWRRMSGMDRWVEDQLESERKNPLY